MKQQNHKPKKKTLKAEKTKRAKKSNKPKRRYRLRNWSEYNEALKQRGSLDVWIDEGIQEKWYAEPTGKIGAQPVYSDLAITLTLQLGIVFHQRLRQTEGSTKSLFQLMNTPLKVPDYSTLSRRGKTLKVFLPKEVKGNAVLILDSSGLKVYGEGEWKVRQHGYSKRRTWRKIHLAITPDGEVRAVELTQNSISDDEAAGKLLVQEESRIDGFIGDGAYDKRKVYDMCIRREIPHILIPPGKNARIWQHGKSRAKPHPRDENLRDIRSTSRKRWKERVKYHIRSLVESAIFRFKSIFGDKLHARKLGQQKTEAGIKVAILNLMMRLGMPQSYAVA